MTAHTCPICTDQFETAGAARDHTWNVHSACHYCGEQLGDETDEQLYRHWLVAHPDDLSGVDYKRAETAVDSLTFSERLSEGGVGAAVGGLTRRQLLLGGGGAATAGLVIGATALSNNTSTEPDDGATAGGDTGAVTTAPIPDSPGDFRYATMGSADADVMVTYFGSWKCPYCAQFSTEMLSQLVTDYVEPGQLHRGQQRCMRPSLLGVRSDIPRLKLPPRIVARLFARLCCGSRGRQRRERRQADT